MNSSVHPNIEHTPHIRVLDEWQENIPEDLYIPPSAFEILLDHFEGPLDFLIYLIQKNGFDLIQLDIAPIATQYLHYIEKMKSYNIELTADYLVMAALLADLKSRLLLPKPATLVLEDNPKQQLIDRLEQYLRIKHAAEHLASLPVLDRDTFPAQVAIGQIAHVYDGYDVNDLHRALCQIFNRPEPVVHRIEHEPVLLEERIECIQQLLATGEALSFEQLLSPSQGKMGMVVTFMAILELTRQQSIQVLSNGVDAPLCVQKVRV